MKLSLDMEHNLNVIKEITVTDSFLSMDKDIRGCQKESYDDCTTNKYINALTDKCQCLPFQLKLTEEVTRTDCQKCNAYDNFIL